MASTKPRSPSLSVVNAALRIGVQGRAADSALAEAPSRRRQKGHHRRQHP